MTNEEIAQKAELFFDFPTDNHDTVTFTSAVLFASYCVAEDAPTDLIAVLTAQTKDINALVESNQRLMSILLEGAADEPEESMLTYLDGTPKA